MESIGRRMFNLTEPIAAVGYGGKALAAECHVLHALSIGMPAEKFGRVHHLPAAQLAAVVAGMRERGLIDDSGRLSTAGRETKERIEALTDNLAAPAYDFLTPAELDELVAILQPISAGLGRPRRSGRCWVGRLGSRWPAWRQSGLDAGDRNA